MQATETTEAQAAQDAYGHARDYGDDPTGILHDFEVAAAGDGIDLPGVYFERRTAAPDSELRESVARFRGRDELLLEIESESEEELETARDDLDSRLAPNGAPTLGEVLVNIANRLSGTAGSLSYLAENPHGFRGELDPAEVRSGLGKCREARSHISSQLTRLEKALRASA